jgi:phosphoesterase RecJ-like protein
VATSLYTAILTDTGSFRFANTTERTLRIAGDLLSKGVSPSFVAEQVYEVKPLGSVRLLAAVLSTLQVSECGRVAWLSVRSGTLERCGVDSSETEGFVNYARMISGVAVGLLFREVSPAMTKVSWRSRDRHDVSQMAGRFGGGGHLNAAGCEIEAPIDEAIAVATEVALSSLDQEERSRLSVGAGADS